MQPRSVLLFTLCLCILFCGCRKKKDEPRPSGTGLKGIVVYTSCATTVIRITNKEMGVSWTNCHNQQSYEHVIDAYIPGAGRVLNQGDVIDFDVIPDEPVDRCKIIDCVPSLTVTIKLR